MKVYTLDRRAAAYGAGTVHEVVDCIRPPRGVNRVLQPLPPSSLNALP